MNQLDQVAAWIAEEYPARIEILLQAISAFLDAYPDSRFPIDDVIAEGDEVAIRHSLRGTHRAPFQGIAPTGKAVKVSAIATFRVVNGKVAETWLNADLLGMLQQLGAIPAPG